MAMEQQLDITKLSFHAWLTIRQAYTLLQSGAALGYGCGPVLIASRPLSRRELASARVVFPGRWTTAHLLFRLWAPEAENRLFTTYDRIFDMLASGGADAGVIIHENRFTFTQAGFTEIVDLGAWWEAETGLPIPLGCIAARRTLPDDVPRRVEQLIRESIQRAANHPDEAMPYMREHAQEMESGVLRRHVETFVNDFSLDLGPVGQQAVDTLQQRARQAGIIS
jgi:1,4-dihydroxy-6-naphthoate synthase